MPNVCEVSGSLVDLGMDPVYRAEIIFTPVTNGVLRNGNSIVLPIPESLTTDTNGAIIANLVPARYSVFVAANGVDRTFYVTVPDAPVAELAQLIDLPPPTDVSSLAQAVADAEAARDAANEILAATQQSADQSLGSSAAASANASIAETKANEAITAAGTANGWALASENSAAIADLNADLSAASAAASALSASDADTASTLAASSAAHASASADEVAATLAASRLALPFANRADAIAATVGASVDVISVLSGNELLFYRRDAAGTALTTNGGAVSWAPALDIRAAHYDQDYRSFMPPGTFGGTWRASRILADSDLTTPFSGTRVSQAITRTVTGAGASNPIGDYTQFLVANNPDIMDTTAGELGVLRMLVVANGVGDKDIFIGSVNKQIGDGTINEGAMLAYEMGSRLVDGSLSNIVAHHQILGAFAPNPASVWGGRGHHGYYSEHYKGVGYSHFTGIDDGYGTGLTSMTYGIALFRKRDPATAYFTVAANTGDVESKWNGAGAAGGSWTRTRSKATAAANDIIWNDYWRSKNAAGTEVAYARLYGAISDTTDGSEDGMVQFLTLVNGSETAQLQIKNGLAVGNATSGALGTGSVNIASSYSINGATVVDGSRGVRLASYTTAQLNDITNAVNTSQKAEGKMVWNTTLKIPVFAVGATAGSTWNTAAGAVSSTPV